MDLSDDELEASLSLSCGLLSVQVDNDAHARVVSDNGGVAATKYATRPSSL